MVVEEDQRIFMPGQSINKPNETEAAQLDTDRQPHTHAVLQLIVHALLDIYACILFKVLSIPAA